MIHAFSYFSCIDFWETINQFLVDSLPMYKWVTDSVRARFVQSERPPYFGEPDTDIQSWVNALDAWEGSDITHVLPGHGPAVAKSYLGGVSGYFRVLRVSLRSLKLENISGEEVHLSESLPQGYWPKDEMKKPAHNYSIRQLYASL